MSFPGLDDLLVWGVKAGWRLLGRPVDIHVTENGLGYTHPATYGQAVLVYVNPCVLDRPNGETLLRGLILHELGHHVCHFADPAYRKVSLEIHGKHLDGLLNLIMDEHLERRLRARDPAWGESFDALASYAFKGTDLTLGLDQYATLMGIESSDQAAAALLAGDAPGRIVDFEHGYLLNGCSDRWVSFTEFTVMLEEALLESRHGRPLPEDIAKEMQRLYLEAGTTAMRATSDGLLALLHEHRLFKPPDQLARSSWSETVVRINVASIIEDVPRQPDDIPAYLDSLKRTIAPLQACFPQLGRLIQELEASAASPWFWNKRNAMLYMMRRSRDFRFTFSKVDQMSAGEIRALLGEAIFDPALILLDLEERTRPQPHQNLERPNLVEIPWTKVLAATGTSPLARVFVSLRLGLGRQLLGDDPIASAALAAIPRRLRHLDMHGLGAVTAEVGRILGPEAGDTAPKASTAEGKGSRVRAPAPESVGSLISKKIAGIYKELGCPPHECRMSDKQQAAAREHAREAARRIDHWLRTGVDPATEEAIDRPKITTGGKPVGRAVIRRKPPRGHRDVTGQHDGTLMDLLNLAATLEFDPITSTVLPQAKPAEYAALIEPIRRQIGTLRAYLASSGHDEVEDPAHRRGRRLDPGRLHRLASLNLPDVFIGLEQRPAPDLFLGICIDCSGSMGFEDRMDKALGFGALLLEAARDLPGIDGHALGFDDDTIFEVGPPGSSRLAGLRPGGGNNDAAGLLALARHALLSGRSRRLLVMISDGYPTACSLDSLTNLVVVLERRFRLRCVQVAVAEMDHERLAFPRFTDLTQHDRTMAVHMFGRLVRRTLQREFGA